MELSIKKCSSNISHIRDFCIIFIICFCLTFDFNIVTFHREYICGIGIIRVGTKDTIEPSLSHLIIGIIRCWLIMQVNFSRCKS